MAIAATALSGCRKKEEAPSPLTVVPSKINLGSRIFQQKCIVCHRVYGAGGTIGRDLSHAGRIYQRDYLGSVLDHETYPPEMPSFRDLPREEREALIEYLMSLK